MTTKVKERSIADAHASGKVRAIAIRDIASVHPASRRDDYPKDEIKALALSMCEVGQLHPAVVRPHVDRDGQFELLIGSRRMKALQSLQAETINATIADVNDDEAVRMIIIENLQRENVTPWEQAKLLNQMRDTGEQWVDIGAAIGASPQFCARRAKLADMDVRLVKYTQKHSTAVGIIEMLAALPDNIQTEIAKSAETMEQICGSATLTNARQMIERDYLRKLTAMPFDIKDEKLEPKAGACTNCPKTTAADGQFAFAQVKKSDAMCLDHACAHRKIERHLTDTVANIHLKHGTVWCITTKSGDGVAKLRTKWGKIGKGVKVMQEWAVVEAKGSDLGAERSVYIDGPSVGKVGYRMKPKPDSKPEKTPKLSPADKRKAQRQAHIVDAVRETMVSRSDAESSTPAGFVHKFGTIQFARVLAVAGMETNAELDLDTLKGRSKYSTKQVAMVVEKSVTLVLSDRLTRKGLNSIETIYALACEIGKLYEWFDLKLLQSNALDAVPEPVKKTKA